MEKNSGVNVAGIDKLSIDIIDYADKINKILNQIQELANNTNIYFDSPSGNEFRKSFANLESNYQIMNQNILNYARDLVKVKTTYQAKENDIADNAQKIVSKK